MKISTEDYIALKALIEPLKEKIQEHRAWLLRNATPADLELRLRWDVLRMAGGIQFICDNLYGYMDDKHIDTALRHVMAEIGEYVPTGKV